jgi:hypothetical protein
MRRPESRESLLSLALFSQISRGSQFSSALEELLFTLHKNRTMETGYTSQQLRRRMRSLSNSLPNSPPPSHSRRRRNNNALVLTDPKVYATPIKITATLRHRPDLQLLEYTCTDSLWDEYLSERGLMLPDVDAFPDPRD